MRTDPSSASVVRRPALAALLPLAVLALAACGGGDDGPTGNGNGTLSVAAGTPSGNAQTAAAGAELPQPLRVLVRRDGTPAAGVSVAWSVTAGGGQVNPATSTTGADGTATTTWQLGAAVGAQGARATVANATGSPVAFTATATGGGGGGNVVAVENNQFQPQTITVAPGATVRWEWGAQSFQHNLVPVAPATIPSVPTARNGPSTYDATFAAAGTYNYYCSIHGTPTTGMRGAVVVQ